MGSGYKTGTGSQVRRRFLRTFPIRPPPASQLHLPPGISRYMRYRMRRGRRYVPYGRPFFRWSSHRRSPCTTSRCRRRLRLTGTTMRMSTHNAVGCSGRIVWHCRDISPEDGYLRDLRTAVVLEDDHVYVGLQDEVPAGDIRKKILDGCHGNLRISRNGYDDVSRHPIGDCEDIGSVRTGDCQVRSEGDGHSGGRDVTADDGQFSRYVTGVYCQRYVLTGNIGRHIDQPCGLRLDISWDP